MLPIFNTNPFNSSQLQPNGTSSSTPQQVMGANPMQMGGIFNPQLNQFAPFPLQGLNNLNPVAMNNNNVANFNASRQMGQFLPQNAMNPAQLFNQNVNLGVPNGQWNLRNPIQNMNATANPFFHMGIPNLGHGVSPQNLAFFANGQLGFVNPGVANQMPNAGLHLQGNLGSTQALNSVQPQQQNQNMFNQALSQGNPGKATDGNQMRGNWKKPHNKNFNGKPKRDASHNGSMKSHFHHKQNSKGNFRVHKDQGGKVTRHQDIMARKPAFSNSTTQNQGEKKRPLLLNYTDQEVRQWREERRKNYPSQANMEKKQKLTEPQTSDEAAKLRRQQLKEILAKQAELGCEVAEVPPCYLSDSEQGVHGRGVKRPFNKKERFENRFNKKGKIHQNDRFSKRHYSGNPDSSNTHEQNDQLTKKQNFRNNVPTCQSAPSKREPTLLQKLLSADIRRDRQHLLQVFRFMVMNSFFRDWPEKALKFPTVLVKDSENEGEFKEKGVTETIHKTGLHELVDDDDVSDTNYDDNGETLVANHDQDRVAMLKQGPQEEEGEIID